MVLNIGDRFIWTDVTADDDTPPATVVSVDIKHYGCDNDRIGYVYDDEPKATYYSGSQVMNDWTKKIS